MKDLNKLKEEAWQEFKNEFDSYSIAHFEFSKGWDACVKCLEASPTVTIQDREIKFIMEFKEIISKIHIINNFETYSEFVSYWTEPNKSKTKMRFELEKTWDTTRRLQTWIKRDKKFNPSVGGKKEVVRMEGNYLKDHF